MAISCAVATTLVAAVPSLPLAHHTLIFSTSLATAVVIVALFSGVLVAGRYWANCCLDDLLLLCAFVLIAGSATVFGFPAAAFRATHNELVWAGISGSVLSGIVLALAALTPPTKLSRRGLPALVAGLACAAALGLLALLFTVVIDDLPSGISEKVLREGPSDPTLGAHPAVLVVQAIGALAFAAAALGFMRKSERTNDGFLAWLAVGCVFAGFARVNYFMFPSFYSEWLYSGDIFRALAYAAFFVGGVREVTSYWRKLADFAVAEERRRIARDFHDGVAQELALITRNAQLLEPTAPAEEISGAAQRALSEARRAITALGEGSPSLRDTIEHEARLTADEAGRKLAVDLDIDSGIEMSAVRREAIVRILRDAVSNVSRHSGSDLVKIELQPEGHLVRLRVSDRGKGFAVESTNGGFGLVSMRERTNAMGGRFTLTSSPGKGTVVEAVL